MRDLHPRVLQRLTQPHSTAEYSPLSLLYSLTLSALFLARLGVQSMVEPLQAHDTPKPSVVAATAPPTVSPSATPSASPSPTVYPQKAILQTTDIEELLEQRESIRQYIYTIFGKQGPTAYAIALAESGKSYKGERYFATFAVNSSDIERSVGVFQINLQNKETKVHYHRVPGTTLKEKTEWLQDPYNNTLMAHWIYSHSHFNPWTTYTDGTYLKYMR